MFSQVFHYLGHLITAQSRYQVHSPFVYEFVTEVLPHRNTDAGKEIEGLRRAALQSQEILRIQDLGAGYGGAAQAWIEKTEREVIRSSARKRRNGELLLRLAAWQAPEITLELGTNLGYSAAYIQSGLSQGRFITIEGAPVLAQKAAQLWERLGLRAEQRVGEFSAELEVLLQGDLKLDFVLLDGNHRFEATINYFDTLLPHMNPNSLVIVDDINWSPGMQKAWQAISQREEVAVSIDLFFMGLCFLHRSQAKERFRFRFRP